MGYKVHCYGPDGTPSPCGQVGATEFTGAYDDLAALEAFVQSVDVVTFEFENVSVAATDLAQHYAPVRPSGQVLFTTQDRIREKTALVDISIPVASFLIVYVVEDLTAANFPGILKTAQNGYDGKGQRLVKSLAEATVAFHDFGGVPCVLEAVVPFLWEGSIVGARNVSGEVALYPLVHNVHTHHILDTTVAPAPKASTALQQHAADLADRIITELDVVGILCIEMFITEAGIVVNELAPRPHNSGHWTLEGCTTSQFEQHVRAVCGLPLGDTSLRSPSVAMANLLGDCWPDPDWVGAMADPRVIFHLYGKGEARHGRKMGHVTATGSSPSSVLEMVTAARNRLTAT